MNDVAPKKKRTWLWIVLGVFLFFVVVAIGGIIFTVSLVRQNMTITGMSASNADEEFEAVRAKFAGQQPFIQMIDGRPQYVADSATKSPSTTPLKAMHVMAWDDDEQKLVTFSLPFWVLRMKSGPIRLSAYSAGLGRSRRQLPHRGSRTSWTWLGPRRCTNGEKGASLSGQSKKSPHACEEVLFRLGSRNRRNCRLRLLEAGAARADNRRHVIEQRRVRHCQVAELRCRDFQQQWHRPPL